MLLKQLYLFFIVISFSGFCQSDTITVVSYNLLNFPEGRNDCTNNTVVPDRADTLRKIVKYLNPDIFVACEIQTQEGADSVLTRSFNVYGQSNYAKATFNLANVGQSLYNQLYYNTDKLTLQYQDYINTYPRVIDHYVLYLNDPNLSQFYDTTFIEVYMCHLKAGSGSAEQNERAQQAQEIANFIQQRPSNRHHLVCGDLNVYTSNEQAYQIFLNSGVGLVDPINQPGNWNNNSSFAGIHTQSTRSGENLDCGSQGGSDDRFDQILVSPNVMVGSDSLRYLTNSYKAVGNDGNHYNLSLISNPVNSLYPDSVVKALYYMSDHLPVAMSMFATYPTSNGLALFPSYTGTSCYGSNDGTASITPNDGQPPYQYLWDSNAGNQTTSTATGLFSGSYCVTVTDALGEVDDYCIFVPQPDSISLAGFMSPDDGSCSGEAFVISSGGSAPYTIQWNDPNAQTGFAAYNLCAGLYTATVTDDAGCVNSLQFEIADNSIGLSQMNLDNIIVYPNPVSSILTLENLPDNTTVNIVDLAGNSISLQEFNEKIVTIDLSALKQGLYFVRLISADLKRTLRISKVD